MLSTHSSFFVLSNRTFSADSVAGWDQLVLDFAPGLLPRAGKWSQLIPSAPPSHLPYPRAYPRQGFRSSSKSPALVSLDFVVVVIGKYWVIHKPLVRAFGSISQLQLLAGPLSPVLGTGGIASSGKELLNLIPSAVEMVP